MNRVLKNLAFRTWDRLAFASLLASGAFIILLSSDNLLGSYFSRPTKAFIYFLPWMLLWPRYSFELVTNKTRRG